MILVVDEDLTGFEKVNETSFNNLDIWERNHIQEWIRQSPEILGEELLIVSIEFDRFKNSNDRLDLLAIDRVGNIVVIELKRDSFAGYADLQAIRYAAMTSSMTVETLLPYYKHYKMKYLNEENPSNDHLRAAIEEFVSDDNFKELSNNPRIILCSEDFSQEITTSVLWLNSNGLDISCVKIKPHSIGDKVIIVPNKIIPLKEAQQYLIEIINKEESESKRSRNRPRTMRLLIENNLIKEGDYIYLKKDLPSWVEYQDTIFFKAQITGKLGRSNAVKWLKDENEYSISSLTWHIFKDLHPENKDPGGVNGNWHWVNDKNRPLWELAENWWIENRGNML